METELTFINPSNKKEFIVLEIDRESFWGGIKYKMRISFIDGRKADSYEVFKTNKDDDIEFYLNDRRSVYADFKVRLEPNHLFTAWYDQLKKVELFTDKKKKVFELKL